MRLSTVLMLVPAIVIAVIVALANRETVMFRLDPFAATDAVAPPALTFAMPLFVLIFLSILLGVAMGGTAVWLRRAAKRPARPPAIADHALPPLDSRPAHKDNRAA